MTVTWTPSIEFNEADNLKARLKYGIHIFELDLNSALLIKDKTTLFNWHPQDRRALLMPFFTTINYQLSAIFLNLPDAL